MCGASKKGTARRHIARTYRCRALGNERQTALGAQRDDVGFEILTVRIGHVHHHALAVVDGVRLPECADGDLIRRHADGGNHALAE
jgi:hypothetical protein